MQPLTLEDMLQIGHDCGLTYIDEAYSQIMCHYDAFFRIDNLAQERKTFEDKLRAANLVDENSQYLKYLTISEVANQIGYTLTEIDWDSMPTAVEEDTEEWLTFFSQATGI
jgi:hypothetical protein